MKGSMKRTPRGDGHRERRQRAGAVAIVAVAAITLGACSSSSNKATTGTTAQSTPPTTTELSSAGVSEQLDSTLAAMVPADIKAKGILSVAANATYPPDEYFASDNTTIIGFDPDLAKGVGQILGLKLNFVNSTFANIIPGLQAGHFDIGWSSATATAARQQQVNFVTYFNTGIGFMVPANSTHNIQGLSDLCGLNVAVEAGSLEDTTVTAQSATCTSGGNKAISIQRYQTENENVLALTSGRADVSPAGSQIIPYLVHQSKGQLKSVGTPYNVAPVGIEFPKTTPIGLAQAFQGALNKMIANGTYGRILAYWGEQAGAIAQAQILPPPAG